jgi:hypothetical protein
MSMPIVVKGIVKKQVLGAPVEILYEKTLDPNRQWTKSLLGKLSALCPCGAHIIIDTDENLANLSNNKSTNPADMVGMAILRKQHLKHGVDSGDLVTYLQELSIAAGFDTNLYSDRMETVEVIHCPTCDRTTENRVKFFHNVMVVEWSVVDAIKKFSLHDDLNTRNALALYLKNTGYDLKDYQKHIADLNSDIAKLDTYKTNLESHLEQIKSQADFQSALADDGEYKLKRGMLESYETLKKDLNSALEREANVIYGCCHRRGPPTAEEARLLAEADRKLGPMAENPRGD